MTAYRCETWALQRQETQRIETAEVKLLRRIKCCSLRHQGRNEDIRAKLAIYSMNDRIRHDSLQWEQRTGRMSNDFLIKQALNYKFQGRRDVGRPRIRWQD